ncbi:hypothetical protein M3226_20235 [Neobacillus cucumis]|uniref:hypothetical protein n=1 Tax=Neobacillus cucumis TaxID=1740721 RepID=UPI00203A63D7|nr:hypothetical protein [Neobacillus cucumis]MCM3727980.1 hypothetical protein [Neobacillus cucumis]
MTRLELYHQHKTEKFSWTGLFFFIVVSLILTASLFVFSYYYQHSIKIEEPQEKLGEKVVIQMPNGQKVYTY